MANDPNISILLDIYGNVLTDKQRDCLDLFYNQDLSFSEIAEHYNITRQGACDFITRGRLVLLDLENKIGYLDKLSETKNNIHKIIDLLNQLSKYNDCYFKSFKIDCLIKSIYNITKNLSEE